MGGHLARTLAELEELIRKKPEESPSVFLPDDGLAGLYYDRYSIRALKRFFEGDPDRELCERFSASPGEWREAVSMALLAKRTLQKRQETVP